MMKNSNKTLKNFFKSVTSGNNKFVLAGLLLVVVGVYVFIGPLHEGSVIGFNQGTQGLGYTFDSIYWNNAWWSATSKGGPDGYNAPMASQQSIAQDFGGSLNFAPDTSGSTGAFGMPTLGGTFGAMTADLSSAENYSWSVPSGTVVQNGQTLKVEKSFQMEQVLTTMSFNIYLSGTGSEAGAANGLGNLDVKPPNYAGAQVWIKIEPQDFLYFQGNPNQFFIAPSLIQVASVTPSVKGVGGGISGLSSSDTQKLYDGVSTNPGAVGDIFYLYYNPTNNPSQQQIKNLDSTVLTMANGQQLDPSIFRNQYYICLSLNDFMAYNDWGFLGLQYHHYAFPSLNFKLQMYVWVVGEWTTYFKQSETIKQQPHPIVSGSQNTALGDVSDLLNSVLSNPLDMMIILGVVIIVLAALIVVFFPGVAKLINAGANKASTKVKGKARRRKR